MKQLYLLTSLFLLLGSLPAAFAEEKEALLGLSVDHEGITFQVASGGCTEKEDFQIEWAANTAMPAQMTLVRMKPDFCKALFPYGTKITFTYEELDLNRGAEFKVRNPIAVIRVY